MWKCVDLSHKSKIWNDLSKKATSEYLNYVWNKSDKTLWWLYDAIFSFSSPTKWAMCGIFQYSFNVNLSWTLSKCASHEGGSRNLKYSFCDALRCHIMRGLDWTSSAALWKRLTIKGEGELFIFSTEPPRIDCENVIVSLHKVILTCDQHWPQRLKTCGRLSGGLGCCPPQCWTAACETAVSQTR